MPLPAARRPAPAPLLIASVVAAIVAQGALAQSVATGSSATARGLDALQEVIVTATPLRSSVLETAQPLRVIGGDTLVRTRAASLGETLAGTPGVSANYFGPIASRPLIRGQGGQRVQVYQDGGDALDASALSDDHAVTVEPLLADRIEVIRGPAALMFGSAAAAGAINVVTQRIPDRIPERGFATALELRGDDGLDERAVAARADARLGSHWVLHGDLHRRTTGNAHIPGYAWSEALRDEAAAAGEPVDETQERLLNSDSESDGRSAGLSRIGETGWFGVSVSDFATEYGLPGPGEEAGEPPGVRLDMEQRRYDVAGEWRPATGLLSSLRLRASRNDYEHAEIEPEGDVGTVYSQLGEELRLGAEHRELGGWRGSLGLQWRDIDFDAEGAEAFLPPSMTRNLGVFLFEEKRFGALTLEAGARLEQQRIQVRSADPAPDYDDDGLSGSLGALWTLRPDTTLALQLTSTERHPTATELYASGPHLAVGRFETGNAELGTETARTADLGLRLGGSDAGWTASVSVFLSDYSDYIVAAPTGGFEDGLPAIEYQATDARFAGAELEWAHPRLAETRAGRVGARLFGDIVEAEDADGEPLPQIPPVRLGAELSLTGDRLALSVEAIWHDRQDRLADNERGTAGFTLLGADLSYRLPVATGSMLVFLRGSNLLDEEARRHASPLKDYAPLTGRSIAAGLRLEF